MYLTYIIYSSSLNKYYTGHTSNIEERLISHNKGSNKFTKRGIPWELVYIKKFDNKAEAIKYELYLKRMKSKKFIENLTSVG